MKDTMHRITTLLHGVMVAADYRVSRSGMGCAGQDSWVRFEAMARGEGFKLLGCGHFAAVFSHPDLDGYAIKVGFKKDDSGAAYAAYCRAHQGEAGIPNIHLIKRFSRAYMVVMDKLRSLDDIGRHYCQVCDTYDQQVLDLSYRVSNAVIDYGILPHEAVMDYVDRHRVNEYQPVAHIEMQYIKELAKTCESIHNYFKEIAQFDLHRANVMVNGKGQLVITDPVSWTVEDDDDNMARLNEACE